MKFKDKVIIITGGSSGIGKGTAIEFANHGAIVLIADIDEVLGRETVKLIKEEGGNAEFLKVDVTKEPDIVEMIRYTIQHFGKLDYAFNNAGIGETLNRSPLELDLKDWQKIIDINLTGVFLCMKHEVKALLDQGSGGVIINTSSVTGKVGSSMIPSYSASKHGVMGLTKSFAQLYAKKNIRVCAINPSFIETPILNKSGLDRDNPKHMNMVMNAAPMGRMGTIDEIAKAVAFLCSADASFITGIGLDIDGGFLS